MDEEKLMGGDRDGGLGLARSTQLRYCPLASVRYLASKVLKIGRYVLGFWPSDTDI